MSFAIPLQLRKLYREGRIIPFVGAGASMSVSWTRNGNVCRGPSWRELVDEAARILGFSIPDLARVRGTDLQILEYFRIRHHGEFTKLTNWLVRNMDPPDAALASSEIHRELVALDRCPLFYTTNFDDLLERAFRVNGRSCDIVASEADMGGFSNGCEVVKFHGDLEHPKMMVLSESDYESRLAFDTPMDHKLRSDMLGRAILFLGYSFRDANVSYLFHLINEKLGQLPGSTTGMRAYIVVADPSDFEITLFHQRNIEVIPVVTDKDGPTIQVANVLKAMRE